MKPLTKILLTVLMAASLFSCGGTGDEDEGGNQPPIASFTIDPPSTPAGDSHNTVVTLDASDSSDPDGDALSFSWTVQSGIFVEGTTPSSQVAKVTFPGISDYAVSLQVTDPSGASDTATGTVFVE